MEFNAAWINRRSTFSSLQHDNAHAEVLVLCGSQAHVQVQAQHIPGVLNMAANLPHFLQLCLKQTNPQPPSVVDQSPDQLSGVLPSIVTICKPTSVVGDT